MDTADARSAGSSGLDGSNAFPRLAKASLQRPTGDFNKKTKETPDICPRPEDLCPGSVAKTESRRKPTKSRTSFRGDEHETRRGCATPRLGTRSAGVVRASGRERDPIGTEASSTACWRSVSRSVPARRSGAARGSTPAPNDPPPSPLEVAAPGRRCRVARQRPPVRRRDRRAPPPPRGSAPTAASPAGRPAWPWSAGSGGACRPRAARHSAG